MLRNPAFRGLERRSGPGHTRVNVKVKVTVTVTVTVEVRDRKSYQFAQGKLARSAGEQGERSRERKRETGPPRREKG